MKLCLFAAALLALPVLLGLFVALSGWLLSDEERAEIDPGVNSREENYAGRNG